MAVFSLTMKKKAPHTTKMLPLSKRFLISILFMTTLFSILSGVFLFITLPPSNQHNTLSLCFSILFGLLYYWSKKRINLHQVTIAFIIVSLLLLYIAWFLDGGFRGSTGYFSIIAIAFFIIIAPLKYRFLLLGIILFSVLTLFAIEYNYPQYITHNPNIDAHNLALLVTIISTIIIISWGLSTTKIEYEKEHNKTKEQNQALVNAHLEKSRFLANVSHEVRTPMNGVMGMASLLNETNLTEEQQEYVETIVLSSDKLLTIINQILDFSKAEAGKTELYNTAFNIEQCINNAFEICIPHAIDKQLELAYSLEKNVPRTIVGDSGKLGQVLINLIDNAIKFTLMGAIHLKIELQSEQGQLPKLLFTLEDTGIGIPTSQIKHLFESFTQVDDSTTRQHNGTGLGLAISKRLVELMEGKIWVESELGKGSTFFFIIKVNPIPNLIEKVDPLNTINNNSIKEKVALNILIVEDDKINRLLAVRLFEKIGYNADIAINGQEAVDIVSKKDYDLVFMDIQMPVMDGLTATEIIRKEHTHQPIIIAMTANAMTEDKLLCKIAGMDDFLTKPVKLNALEKMLKMWQQTL
jgi:signal transduction histidine kinase/CheY-like chemotaxis protein